MEWCVVGDSTGDGASEPAILDTSSLLSSVLDRSLCSNERWRVDLDRLWLLGKEVNISWLN